jgi:hypothetical protein
VLYTDDVYGEKGFAKDHIIVVLGLYCGMYTVSKVVTQ